MLQIKLMLLFLKKNGYNVSKKDRDNFKQSFGKNSDLYPEDIEEIIFRNKIIYKKGE